MAPSWKDVERSKHDGSPEKQTDGDHRRDRQPYHCGQPKITQHLVHGKKIEFYTKPMRTTITPENKNNFKISL